MNWARKGLIYLLLFILLVALIGTAFSTSTNIAFSHPDKIENWLNQSHFYDNFVAYTINQSKKSTAPTENQGSVTLSDAAVQQAAIAAFSPQLVQRSINKVLDSNYAWLQGKTNQPNFVIDLTNDKQNFANLVGQYVEQHIANLPVCTAQQLAELGNIENVDPLNITCRPPGVDPKAEASVVSQRVANSSDFLSNPVISANNVSAGNNSGQPYYQQYSSLPKLYKLGVRLPLVYAGIALLSILCMVLIAKPKRFGAKRVGVAFGIAGIVLVILEPLFSATISGVEKHILKISNLGQLERSVTDVLHRAGHQWTMVDLWFGIAYLLVAAILLTIFRRKKVLAPAPADAPKAPTQPDVDPSQPVQTEAQSSRPGPDIDVHERLRPRPTGPPPRPKKPPRLIQ